MTDGVLDEHVSNGDVVLGEHVSNGDGGDDQVCSRRRDLVLLLS